MAVMSRVESLGCVPKSALDGGASQGLVSWIFQALVNMLTLVARHAMTLAPALILRDKFVSANYKSRSSISASKFSSERPSLESGENHGERRHREMRQRPAAVIGQVLSKASPLLAIEY